MRELRCRLLKGFYTADWYKDYKNHTSVEIWARYGKETEEIVDYQLRIHQSIVDSNSGYKTLEEVEKVYEDRKEYFSKEYSHVEQKEKVTEAYEKLVAVKKQSEGVRGVKLLNMEKVVTVLHTGYIPYMRKYKELAEELENDKYIEVEFPRGMYKQRMKQLTELGYSLVSWSWEPAEDTPIYSYYRGYFQRA